MSEQANVQTLRDRAQHLNEQVKARVEQINKEVRELYNKVESRVSDLLEDYKRFDSPVDALKEGSSKFTQSARDLQQHQIDRLSDLGNQLVSRLGLPTRADIQALDKKLTTLSNKVKKIEKAAKSK
jgi:polyhydroxyalkanoate synthesis regulator phasin